MNEVASLNETINIIIKDMPNVEFDFIVILSPKSEKEAFVNANNLPNLFSVPIKVKVQKYPGLGGAYAHGIELAGGDYILMIASDLETDPNLVKELIQMSVVNPDCIITTTRWSGESAGFEDYGLIKKVFNWIFQKWISILYKSKLTDYTFGFRLYPAKSIKSVQWKSRDFAFLLEAILVPIKKGWKTVEIPHFWQKRIEGTSNNSVRYFFAYFKIAIVLKFIS
jgi:glycosyltransferase involved in cell wall biosynthesis